MRVLQVSSEIFPLLKTGGLADVAGALPAALVAQGADVRLLLPGLPDIQRGLSDAGLVAPIRAPWGETATIRLGRLTTVGDVRAYVIDAPSLYGRPGNPYQDEHGQPYPDNHRRFALLGYAAAQLAQGLHADWLPRVVHAHDWHAALAHAYLAHAPRHPTRPVHGVYTVHNLAYQGLFPPAVMPELGLPAQAFSMHGLEFHGQVSFMKAGLVYADRITTVSPTYAREIQTPEQGFGLDGLLRARSGVLSGILNGVDESVWDPAHDRLIAHPYDTGRMAGKARQKAALQAALGLTVEPKALLFGMVSRLADQKGVPLLLRALPEILARGGQLAVLGSGEPALEQALAHAAQAHPASVALHAGYDEALAHRMFAGTDVTLVPSRYEPCGLTQMYGLRYGSLPLVRHVGGLADTVVDSSLEALADGEATGFVFHRFEPDSLRRAVRRAFALYARPTDWRAVRSRGMAQRFGWDAAARQYLALYRMLAPELPAEGST